MHATAPKLPSEKGKLPAPPRGDVQPDKRRIRVRGGEHGEQPTAAAPDVQHSAELLSRKERRSLIAGELGEGRII